MSSTGISEDKAELQLLVDGDAGARVKRSRTSRPPDILRDFDEVRKTLEAAARSIDALLTAPSQVNTEIRSLVERLTARGSLDAFRAQLQEREALIQRQNAMLKNLRTQMDAAHSELDAARARTEKSLAQPPRPGAITMLKDAEAKLEAVHTELDAERARVEAARADAAQMTAEFDRALDELRREHATVVEEQALECTSLPLDGLLTVFVALKRATTLPELLTSFMNGIAREFSRVALFEVNGKSLRGARQVGFHFESDISKVAIPFVADSLLVRAINTGRLESFFADAQNDAAIVLPFGGTPACALAIPIVVQGKTVAVMYADDSDRPEFNQGAPKTRLKFAELLHQHTQLVLLKIWLDQKSRAELRDYVASLTNKLSEEYAAGAQIGRNRLQCQECLKEGLERARRLFAQRIAREDPASAPLLDEHLLEVARARSDTGFGQDLAVLLQSADRTRTPVAMRI